MISVYTASGIMSPILRRAREVYPGHMVRFVEWKELDKLHSQPKGFGKKWHIHIEYLSHTTLTMRSR